MNDIPGVRAVSDAAPYFVRLQSGGHEWAADEAVAAGGADLGPTAHELLLSAAPGGNDIRRRVTVRGALSAGQRARLLQIANACPIHQVLSGEVQIATSLA